MTLTNAYSSLFASGSVHLSSLTPGVTVAPGSGPMSVILTGANPGDTVHLFSEAVAPGAGSAPGLDLCCMGDIAVTIPEGLLCTPETLPSEVDLHIRSFSLLEFDIERSARDFLSDPPMKKRRLLELIARLADRDGIDLREDEYLRDLAQCLEMKPEEYVDLVLEYDVERLRESFESVRISYVPDLQGSGPLAAPRGEDVPRWRRGSQRPPSL